MSFLREMTGALTCSGYHGPRVRELFSEMDLHHCVNSDIRPRIGHHLLGEEVIYPATNPGPPVSAQRRGRSDVDSFLQIAGRLGIRVEP